MTGNCHVRFWRRAGEANFSRLAIEVHGRLRAVFAAPDPETSCTLPAKFAADFAPTAPAAVATLERGFDDATAVLALPIHYRTRLRTTNGVERLNEEIRRRERVIRIFPNRESALRLLGALLMEQDDAWTTGHRYFDMAAYWQWRHRDVSCAQPLHATPSATPREVPAP